MATKSPQLMSNELWWLDRTSANPLDDFWTTTTSVVSITMAQHVPSRYSRKDADWPTSRGRGLAAVRSNETSQSFWYQIHWLLVWCLCYSALSIASIRRVDARSLGHIDDQWRKYLASCMIYEKADIVSGGWILGGKTRQQSNVDDKRKEGFPFLPDLVPDLLDIQSRLGWPKRESVLLFTLLLTTNHVFLSSVPSTISIISHREPVYIGTWERNGYC